MKKALSEMTLEELWQLFPIQLTEHNPAWVQWYREEKQRILQVLPAQTVTRISHIGSTAIPTIWAKPIVDILLEVYPTADLQPMQNLLVNAGYLCMSQEENRLSLNKGYTAEGFAERVFHLHLRYDGDHDELYFRDYLLENQRAAKEYEALKLALWKQYEHDRDAYTQSKTALIRKYTDAAKAAYPKRY